MIYISRVIYKLFHENEFTHCTLMSVEESFVLKQMKFKSQNYIYNVYIVVVYI